MRLSLADFRPSRLFLILIFLTGSLGFILYQRTHKLRVFVLHSYDASMPWVQGLDKGLDRIFKKRHYIDTRSFYMKLKHNNSPGYMRRRTRQALSLIKRYKPDLILIFDINAQKLVVKKLSKKQDFKIVLAGITDRADLKAFKLAKNITGVVEKIPVQVVQEVLSLMFKKERRIYYLSDDSMAAQQLDRDIEKANWGDFNLLSHKKVRTFLEWKTMILNAQSRADVILLSTYQTIKDKGHKVSSIKLINWTLAHSKIPVIGLYESFVNDGGYLSISIASYEQGYMAAKIALFILEKKLKIEDLPFVRSQMFQLLLRKRKILTHYPNITIPRILEAFSNTRWQLDDLLVKKGQKK